MVIYWVLSRANYEYRQELGVSTIVLFAGGDDHGTKEMYNHTEALIWFDGAVVTE